MRNLIKLIPVFAGIVFATSCGHHQESPLSLDNGKPWIANPETTMGVNNMIGLMDAFTDKENVTAYDELN